MEDELAALRARIEQLERRADHVLGLADRIAGSVSSIQELEDNFIMPMLLRLGDDCYRERMLGWLGKLVQSAQTDVEEDGGDRRDLYRRQYWREIVQKREPYPDFPPDGWMALSEGS